LKKKKLVSTSGRSEEGGFKLKRVIEVGCLGLAGIKFMENKEPTLTELTRE